MVFRASLKRNLAWSLGLILVLAITSHAQVRRAYAGPYELGAYAGEATFNYLLVGNDTVLDGPFRLERSSLDALLEKKDISFSFNGAFNENIPEGPWRFQFGEFESDRESKVVDYQYRVRVSGIQTAGIGTIRRGKPHGLWEFGKQQIENSEIVKTLFKSSITFDNGIPQKSFNIETDSSSLVGRFLRNGLAHDQWSLYVNEALEEIERWHFNEGRLTKIEWVSSGQETSFFPNASSRDTKIITLDRQYLELLSLMQPANHTSNVLKSGIYGLLRENAEYYQDIHTILNELGDAAFVPQLKVRVPHYPLNVEETSKLDQIRSLYKEAHPICKSLLNDSHLNILTRSDEKARSFSEELRALENDFFEPVGTLLTYRDQGILEFLSRDEAIASLWPNGLPQNSATRDVSQNVQKIHALLEIAKYSGNRVKTINEALADKLTLEKQQQDLIALEEKLVTQNDWIQQYVDSLKTQSPKSVADALLGIRTLADRQLTDYAAITVPEAKVDFAKTASDCLKKLTALSKAVGTIPQQQDSLQTLYEDAVWNPFTATIMNEVVKKRLLSAYNKVLVPYLISQASTQLSCENADDLSLLIDQVHERMKVLRDENTSKLERRLRKEQDPKMVLELLNLSKTASAN